MSKINRRQQHTTFIIQQLYDIYKYKMALVTVDIKWKTKMIILFWDKKNVMWDM